VEVQLMGMDQLLSMQKQLMDKVPHGHVIKPEHQGLVVAACGVIEEAVEYLNAIGFKSWRPNPLSREEQLEELVDQFFFWMEEVILSGFTWEEVEAEYRRKHAVNLKRYEDPKKGEFGWDTRGKKGSL